MNSHINPRYALIGFLAFVNTGAWATAINANNAFNSINQLTDEERGAWCLIESYMTTAAAAIQAQANSGCPLTAGTLFVSVAPDGNGMGQLGNILLENKLTKTAEGSKCHVTQLGPGQLDYIKLSNYSTAPNLGFSRFGDIFTGRASLDIVQNSGVPLPFSGTNIDQLTVSVSQTFRLPSAPNVIFRSGSKAIEGNGFPLANWVQYSAYARTSVPYRFPILGLTSGDTFYGATVRGVKGAFPFTSSSYCSVVVVGDFVDIGGVGADVVAHFITTPRALK